MVLDLEVPSRTLEVFLLDLDNIVSRHVPAGLRGRHLTVLQVLSELVIPLLELLQISNKDKECLLPASFGLLKLGNPRF